MNTLLFIPDSSSKKPLYEQLFQTFSNLIINGEIMPGERLPSKRSLSAQLHLSLSTIEAAYSMLLAEGYMVSRPRSGYFACEIKKPLDTKTCLRPNSKSSSAALTHLTDDKIAQKAKQASLIHFTIGKTDISIFPYFTWAKTMKSVIYEMTTFPISSDPQGNITLRTTIAKLIRETRGIRCIPEQIIIGAGIEYLLDIIIQLFEERTAYAFENPFYQRAIDIMHNHHCNIKLIALDNKGISIDDLERSKANIAYVTPSHQMPLGIIMPMDRRMNLLRWAEEQDAYIIEDDFDSEFYYGKRQIPALKSFDCSDRILFIGSFLRSIAPSVRTSYLVLPKKLLPAYRAKFRYYASSVSLIEQFTLTQFINKGHLARHIRRMTLLYEKKRNLLIEGLRNEFSNIDIKISGESAGLHFILMPNIGLSEKELKRRALMKGVLVNGLSEYSTSDFKIPEPTFVLGYGSLSEKEIVQGVKLLGEAWK